MEAGGRRRKEGRKAGRQAGKEGGMEGGRKEGRRQATLIKPRDPHLAGAEQEQRECKHLCGNHPVGDIAHARHGLVLLVLEIV